MNKQKGVTMKLYKVIDKNNKAFHGGNFNYTKYLPKGEKPGEWLPRLNNIEKCSNGYHVTPYWNMWVNNKTDKIYEVEVKGLVEDNSIGVIVKFVCQSFRFIKQIKIKFSKNLNTGDSNTGDSNTGSFNTGDSNTGYHNTGYRNTGSWNTGNLNTGDSNTGDSNTGNWNKSDWNTGNFNTAEVKIIKVFNKNCSRKKWDECKKPSFIFFSLINNDYKQSFINSFNNTTKKDVKLLLKLPNFDYKIFEEISGITKKMIMEKFL